MVTASMVKWSFSGLKQYLNCAKQYQEVKVLKNFAVKETEQMRYGTDVHQALEDYGRDRKTLPLNYQRFKTVVDPLLAIQGDKYFEYEMALTRDKRPCKFDADEYWVRGIADLLIVDGDTAFVVDYKTGSNKYPEPKQLKLMALMVFEHFPKVQTVKAGLLFLLHNSFMPEEYNRANQISYWIDFAGDLTRLELSAKTNHWPPNPSGLCGWCPVNTCAFHKDRADE